MREVIAYSDLESWLQLSETTTTFFCCIKQMLNCKSPFRLNSLKKSASSGAYSIQRPGLASLPPPRPPLNSLRASIASWLSLRSCEAYSSNASMHMA